MNIAVIGTGYLGLTIGTCFADLGNNVNCIDIDQDKVDKLNQGIIPIFEPGLSDLIKRNVMEKRLFFSLDLENAVKNSEIIFIAVGTPPNKDGSADLTAVFKVAESIAPYINNYKTIIVKSTVPIGTNRKVKEIIQKYTTNFDVVSNPEFLREGTAIRDFTVPDRIIIGIDSNKSKEILQNLYCGIARMDKPIVFMNLESAELVKYANNAMLATRISFMNELSHLCEKTGADIKAISKGIGLDRRIGSRFLQAGIGFGGSCFPKDTLALEHMLKKHNCNSRLITAVMDTNEAQKESLLPKIKELLPDLKDKKIAIWGLSFKPKTDDIREAPSIKIIQQLLNENAKISVFDPEAMEKMKNIFPSEITYTNHPHKTIENADCLILLTEWNEFRNISQEKIKELMNQHNFVDGRNVHDPEEMKKVGFNYKGVGR